jgi:peroxin-7
MVTVIPTHPFDGHSVLFSPYSADRLAVVGGTNYGIAGPGALILYQLQPNHGHSEIIKFPWKDVFYDVTWSEVNENILVAAAGNGNIVLFDHTHPQSPTGILDGHKAEVSSVEWSISRGDQYVISGSWDSTIKLWDPSACQCLSTLSGHKGLVYCTVWSPHHPMTISSVSGDGSLKLWDVSNSRNVATVEVGCGELLSCAWNKYDQNILCTGGIDNTLKLWDMRQLSLPIVVLNGHTQSIKQVKFDPHSRTHIASSSYDFTVRLGEKCAFYLSHY